MGDLEPHPLPHPRGACSVPTSSLNSFSVFYRFFKMWTIFKVLIEFIAILLLFHALVFQSRGMEHLSSPTRDRTCTTLDWKVKSQPLECQRSPPLLPSPSRPFSVVSGKLRKDRSKDWEALLFHPPVSHSRVSPLPVHPQV